jgi:hypothetical protein
LHVTEVAFRHKQKHKQKCHDFKLIHNPFPATVRPGSCLGLVIQYKATCDLTRECELVIASDDPNTPVKSLDVTARSSCSDCCPCDACDRRGRKGREERWERERFREGRREEGWERRCRECCERCCREAERAREEREEREDREEREEHDEREERAERDRRERHEHRGREEDEERKEAVDSAMVETKRRKGGFWQTLRSWLLGEREERLRPEGGR